MKTLGRTPPPSRGATPSPWSIGSHRPRPAVNLWPEVVDSQRPASPCPPPGPDSLRQPGLAPLPRPAGPDLGASSASDRPWICPPGVLALRWLDVLPLTRGKVATRPRRLILGHPAASAKVSKLCHVPVKMTSIHAVSRCTFICWPFVGHLLAGRPTVKPMAGIDTIYLTSPGALGYE